MKYCTFFLATIIVIAISSCCPPCEEGELITDAGVDTGIDDDTDSDLDYEEDDREDCDIDEESDGLCRISRERICDESGECHFELCLEGFDLEDTITILFLVPEVPIADTMVNARCSDCDETGCCVTILEGAFIAVVYNHQVEITSLEGCEFVPPLTPGEYNPDGIVLL
ncbi:MAG: hypothetical protein HQ538_01875 [Parcubacteria group bacterium]|nr:hypothetical protein [Parcubacteria group bacterium]